MKKEVKPLPYPIFPSRPKELQESEQFLGELNNLGRVILQDFIKSYKTNDGEIEMKGPCIYLITKNCANKKIYDEYNKALIQFDKDKLKYNIDCHSRAAAAFKKQLKELNKKSEK